MIEVLLTAEHTGIAKLVNTPWRHDPNPELVSMVNFDYQTATCLAAERGFLESVTYLLPTKDQVKKSDICQMEIEYAVRSNNPVILQKILEVHRPCWQEVSSRVNITKTKVGMVHF